MYVLTNTLAIVAGSMLVFLWLRHEKINKSKAFGLAFLLATSIFFFGLDLRLKERTTLEVGFSAIRGIIGGGFAFLVVRKFYSSELSKYFRAIIVAMPLMYSISKIACLHVGCCHGFEYQGPFAYIHEGKSYFPIQLIEIISFAILTIIFALIVRKKEKLDIYLPIVALGLKFLLDYCREARSGPIVFFSWNQVFLLVLILIWISFAQKHKDLMIR